MNHNLKIIFYIIFIIPILILVYFLIKIYNENHSTSIKNFRNKIVNTTLDFNTLKYNIDGVKQDTILSYDFIVKNNGEFPLILYSVNHSCLCTNYTVSKKVVHPTDTAKITLILDTKDKLGFYDINAIVIANTKEKYYRLRLTGSIRKK